MKKDRKKESTSSAPPPDYPYYPAEDDIYHKDKEEKEVDPEITSQHKYPAEKPDAPNEKDINDDVIGGDLDVPGSELDDEQEKIGSEDEENNYYSIGDDDSNDPDEDRGD